MWSNMSGNSDAAQCKHARVFFILASAISSTRVGDSSRRRTTSHDHALHRRVKRVTPLADRPKAAIWSSPPGIEQQIRRRGS
jgi:hypothetical protein